MLLPLLLNLGFAAGVVVTPPPQQIINVGGGGITYYEPTSISSKEVSYYDKEREAIKRIQIEDSEIISIVELCLKTITI
jgi:hypothetical protein